MTPTATGRARRRINPRLQYRREQQPVAGQQRRRHANHQLRRRRQRHDRQSASDRVRLTYDASGRLVAAKTGAFATAYTNDGLGERVSRSGYGASSISGGKQEFVYDAAGHLLGEYDGNGKAIEETVWLGDPGSGSGRALPVAVLMPGKAPYYVAPDQLGAPHQIADAGRNTVWHWDHDPFGNGAPTGNITYNLRFPGQYYDGETGLHYNYFRDYDPSTGRYVQSDPSASRAG